MNYHILTYESLQRKVLWILGWIFMAQSIMVYADPEEVIPGWAIPHELIPFVIRIILWFACATACWICAIIKENSIGFAVAVIMPVERAVSYAWSFVMWLLPGIPGGHLPSFAYMLWWGFFTWLIIQIGAWRGISASKNGKPGEPSEQSLIH